jgi:CRISPR-associated exonuclease Cas4|uniref:CRISPR-associated exonuclease Cas4 n=1 Tax=Dictyoglomus turgidum TaxID=513050 RepID=A0A7C3WVY5_9BACT
MITGSLIESFLICERQAWLMAHQVTPDQDHPYLEIGRLIDEESFTEEKKKISLENMIIDLIKTENKTLIIGEIKKSSKAQDMAKLQLAFYLYSLKNNYGIKADGILIFPKEKRRVRVILDKELEEKIEDTIKKVEILIYRERPPLPQKIPYCKLCAYREFCWS